VGAPSAGPAYRILGRYALCDAVASGGMATVHLGKLLGAVGFSRTVAIKRLHAHVASDPEFVQMFLDEAHLAARIQHPNVVPTLDVVATDGELFLVMEYVQGEALSRLIRATREMGKHVPGRVVASVMAGVLNGLHAAHEARNERGEPLGIVHRDVSPHNVLVGVDGIARVVDFGVAKAGGQVHSTKAGQLKGKISYMAPEQARDDVVNRQTDVYAASVVMWEALTGQRLFHGDNDGVILHRVMTAPVDPPSQVLIQTGQPVAGGSLHELRALDAVVMRGLSRAPAQRFASARDMAYALEHSIRLAPPAEVAEWVASAAAPALQDRARRLAEMDARIAAMSVLRGDAQSTQLLAPRASSTGAYDERTMPLGSAPPIPPTGPQLPPQPPSGPAPYGRPVPPVSNFDGRTAFTPSQPSQMSSISVSTPSADAPPPGPPPRRWWLVGGSAAFGAFAMAAAIVLTAGFVRRHHAQTTPAVRATAATVDSSVAGFNPNVATSTSNAGTSTSDAGTSTPSAGSSTPNVATVALNPAAPSTTAAADTPPPAPTLPDAADPPPSRRVPSGSPSALPTATTRPTATARRGGGGGAGAGPPNGDECKPPYTIDADGNKHYKANCL
jgi:serine/threonine-protein kinase